MASKSPPFLMWYDDNPKLTVAHKIEDAIAAYAGRLGAKATLVLVNEEDLTEYPGVQVRAVTTVRRNTYWVGQEPRPDAPVAEVAPAPAARQPARKPATRKATPAALAASAPVAVAEVAPALAEVAPATPVRVAKNRPAPSAAPAVTAEITPEATPATPRRKTRASA